MSKKRGKNRPPLLTPKRGEAIEIVAPCDCGRFVSVLELKELGHCGSCEHRQLKAEQKKELQIG